MQALGSLVGHEEEFPRLHPRRAVAGGDVGLDDDGHAVPQDELAGSRQATCLFTPASGQPQAYTASLRDLGLDIGETRPVRMLWKAYSLGSQRGPRALAGTYVGQTTAVSAGTAAGGNWLYGGKDTEIALASTATFVGDNAGYDIQYAAMSMTLSLAP